MILNSMEALVPLPQQREPSSRWVPMSVRYVGDVAELVLGGEGKLSSLTTNDPGEPTKKPPGTG